MHVDDNKVSGVSPSDAFIPPQAILTKLVDIEFKENIDPNSVCLDIVVCIEKERVMYFKLMHMYTRSAHRVTRRKSEPFALIAMHPRFIQAAFDTSQHAVATESPTCTLEIPSPPKLSTLPPPPPPEPSPLKPQSNSTVISVSPVSNDGMVTVDIETYKNITSFDFKVVDKHGAPVQIKSEYTYNICALREREYACACVHIFRSSPTP